MSRTRRVRPHYVRRACSADERMLLQTVLGVEEPTRLYLSDSTPEAVLKYDTARKRCRACYVNSYRLGFVSLRRPGETWDALEHRVRAMRPDEFPTWASVTGNLDIRQRW